MPAAARREQLLDEAAAWIIADGLGALTMEGLAARCGASKSLPYRHFAGTDDVLVALYQRELAAVEAHLRRAVDPDASVDATIEALVRAYFELITTRGAALGVLTGTGSHIPALADHGTGPNGLSRLLAHVTGIDRAAADVLAALLTGMSIAASDSLGRGDASRAVIEHLTIAAACGAVASVVDTLSPLPRPKERP
jgi:AcrR family transcriptional regulator